MAHHVLDARPATRHFPGIGRYVFNLARMLIPLLHDDERLLLLHQPTQPSSWDLKAFADKNVEIIEVDASPFTLQQQWIIPRLLSRLSAKVYHSPYYLMPYRPGMPTLLTVYDLIPMLFPEYSTPRARLLFRWSSSLALRAADQITAISEATRRDFLQYFALEPQDIITIPLAADPAFYPRPTAEIEALRQKHDLPEHYLLYLGSNKPHKNLTRLVEAWARIRNTQSFDRAQDKHTTRKTLIIAGAWDDRYPEARQRSEELALGTGVRWLGPLPERDLPPLYSGATAFVFPSLYEGFGLPPLEAMACGTPVACSDTSSLPEVVGDAALLFDPIDVESIAGALRRLLNDDALRAELRARGLEQAARFSWERTAKETLDLYRRIVT